jgi:YYY domain-containing protein
MEALYVLTWSVALALLTILGAPITAVVFERFPHRGAAFSLPVSMLVVTTVIFLVGQFTFGFWTLVVGMGVLACLSVVASHLDGDPDWRAVASAYAVFLVGFLLYLLYASQSLAITPQGGEQFLHYGLTNALVDAETLPPEDFWFAGEPLRYYYGTQLQVALLSMLTGVPVRYGYALGLATFYAMLFVSAYGLGGAIVATQGRSYRLGGALGAIFVAIGGTTTAFVRLVFGWLPADLTAEYGRGAFEGLLTERGMSWEEAVAQGTADEWYWFYSRYVAEGGLHEFPLYSLVKADLHGHSLSTGYIVVAGAIAFSYYLTPAGKRRRRLALVYGGLGLVAGVFGFMNTWALPTAVGVAWLAMAGADAHPATLFPDRLASRLSVTPDETDQLTRRLGAESWRLVLAGILAIPVAIIGVAIASPFLVFGSVPTNDGIGLFPPRTALGPFLVMYGGLAALFAVFLLAKFRPRATNRVHVGTAVAIIATSVLWVVLDFGALAVTGPLLLGAWWLVRTDRASFEAIVLVAGVGLILSMELVHAKVYPFNRVRWNTTLKVAIQGWTLAAVAAGAVSALLLGTVRDRLSSLRDEFESEDHQLDRATVAKRGAPAVLAGVLVLSVVVTSLPFAVLFYTNHVGDAVLSPQEGSVDTLAPHDRWKSLEMESMYWIDSRGNPTIVEAPGRYPYQWRNAVSVLTGANAVAGWNHQEGYRGEDAYDRRATAVEEIYTGSWENATETLRRYDVEYIYVGPSEREMFGDDTLPTFWEFDGISLAFRNQKVQIYAVNASELDRTEQRGHGRETDGN